VLTRDEDFTFLYSCLRKASQKNSLAIHAWVFMNNHLHLLVTPGEESSLPKTMQSVGRRYSHYFNSTYHRSGSLWEGRYKCSLIETERYLLCCYRYIEMNPVRAGIVVNPADYPYSSFHANALGKTDHLVTPHPVFIAFVNGVSESKTSDEVKSDRQFYIDLCREGLDRKLLSEIRRGTERNSGIGSTDFLLKIAKLRS